MRSILTLALFISVTFSSYSQGYSEKDIKKISHQAFIAFDGENYEMALEMYLFLDSLNPSDAENNFMVGSTYMRLVEHREQSLPYFQKAEKLGYSKHVKPLVEVNAAHGFYESDDFYFNIARAYHLNYKFDKAIDYYNEFLQEVADKYHGYHQKDIAIVKRFIENCRSGKEIIQDTLDVKVTILEGINSKYADVAPVISADEKIMFFTSRRPLGERAQRDENGMYVENIYYTTNLGNGKWSTPIAMSDTVNSDENESAVALSPDGRKLIVYKSNSHGTGDLYFTLLEGESWTELMKMQEGINTRAFESSASISPDKQSMYFTSTRPGGLGGEDIYVIHKDTSGNWGKAKSMGDVINTPYDEDAPYIHPDGNTLYFSSKGHESMGGFDIFKSKFDKEKGVWCKPENIGHPINTPEDDIFFVWTEDGKRAYFSTHHQNGSGGEDIYMLEITEHEKETNKALVLVKGKVKAFAPEVPVGAKITVTDKETQEVVGVFESNSVTGDYTLVLKPGRDYVMTVGSESCLPHTENIHTADITSYTEKIVDITLQGLSAGSIAVLNNVFFDYNSAKLKEKSFYELNKFYEVLIDNPGMLVEIAGHTDADGSDAYNVKLSKKRAQAVLKYFSKKGISKKRLVARGYGEKYSIATNTTDEGKALNRRTEMIIHSKKEDQIWKKGYYFLKEYKKNE